MSEMYTVNCDSLAIYSNRSLSSEKLGTYYRDHEVTVYTQEVGERNLYFGKISNTESKWVDMRYLKKVSSDSEGYKTKEFVGVGNEKENYDIAEDDSIYGNSQSSYEELYNRYLKAFGCPPRFTSEVDPRYTNTNNVSVGRAVAKTWFSNPAILSLCPGTVDYLPGFGLKSTKKKDLFNALKSSFESTGDKVMKAATGDSNNDLNGQLYAFKSAYTEYINVVNLLARTAADLMGIGDVTDIIKGSKIKLNSYDYGYYTSRENSQKALNIFEETANALNTAVSDSAYIHFFVNYTNGVTGTESFETSAGESWLEQLLGSDESLSSSARNLEFLFGGSFSDSVKDDFQRVINEATDSHAFLGGIATIASNYIKGGRLVFPKMITGMDYSKSIQCELTFSSIYGDKRSIFKYVTLPAIHLLAMATPKQMSPNMYTYPFLVRAYQQGNINSDLAFISNLDLSRGGSDNTSWTVDGLATEITARFTITPLYSNMMVTSSRNPFLFLQNSSLLEYLGTMCGLDLKQNNLDAKIKLAKKVIGNYVFDTPTVLARAISDSWFVNEGRKFTQIIN